MERELERMACHCGWARSQKIPTHPHTQATNEQRKEAHSARAILRDLALLFLVKWFHHSHPPFHEWVKSFGCILPMCHIKSFVPFSHHPLVYIETTTSVWWWRTKDSFICFMFNCHPAPLIHSIPFLSHHLMRVALFFCFWLWWAKNRFESKTKTKLPEQIFYSKRYRESYALLMRRGLFRNRIHMRQHASPWQMSISHPKNALSERKTGGFLPKRSKALFLCQPLLSSHFAIQPRSASHFKVWL